ncbi:hypothetical protein X798_06529 [Onchocerca flexuosa]|uniref:Uncharacterized protein n=1 Tax=Onchocerca flexuosa TaxID=387005 RepID=A0A238BMM4_9BILA|nr:hypothetical protein X798_06529 [Onchocerca flexuosa]
MRTRNSYSRTFTRSRDSVRNQFPLNKLHNPGRRGKSGSRRGGSNSGSLGSNKDKHFVASKEKIEDSSDGSSVVPAVSNGPKQLENGPKLKQQSITKEEKRESVTPSTAMATTAKQSSQQHSDHQHSKKEKKKQIATIKEMPKYIEPKPFTFSSENKYAALLEADD